MSNCSLASLLLSTLQAAVHKSQLHITLAACCCCCCCFQTLIELPFTHFSIIVIPDFSVAPSALASHLCFMVSVCPSHSFKSLLPSKDFLNNHRFYCFLKKSIHGLPCFSIFSVHVVTVSIGYFPDQCTSMRQSFCLTVFGDDIYTWAEKCLQGHMVLITLSLRNKYLLRTLAMKCIQSFTDGPGCTSIQYSIKLTKICLF